MALTSGKEVVHNNVFNAVVNAKMKSQDISIFSFSSCAYESLITCAELSKQVLAAVGEG
jgi:hypothetical protein